MHRLVTRHIVVRIASIHNVTLFEFAEEKSVDYEHPCSKDLGHLA
jgi:hypothetical protein